MHGRLLNTDGRTPPGNMWKFEELPAFSMDVHAVLEVSRRADPERTSWPHQTQPLWICPQGQSWGRLASWRYGRSDPHRHRRPELNARDGLAIRLDTSADLVADVDTDSTRFIEASAMTTSIPLTRRPRQVRLPRRRGARRKGHERARPISSRRSVLGRDSAAGSAGCTELLRSLVRMGVRWAWLDARGPAGPVHRRSGPGPRRRGDRLPSRSGRPFHADVDDPHSGE